MNRCPHCAGDVPGDSRFCGNCGGSIVSGTSATVTPESLGEGRGSSGGSSLSSIGRLVSSDSGHGARFLAGTLLDERYRIIGLLGKGGMGEVYRADDLKLDQPVALKFLPPALEADPDRLSRFMNEVRIARKVSHPNVCRVYDIGEVPSTPSAGSGQAGSSHYLSMEYVDGEDLATLLRRIGRLPGDKAVEIARQICAGLAAAHKLGIVHRDLKPANIMLDGEGQVRITDFGLAGLAEGIQGAEIRAGTPGYMAPEQLTGKEVSTKSDIYSLGHVLYELFTGKAAFKAETLAEIKELQTRAAPTSPSSVVDQMDPAVERVILRCLEKDPLLRPDSALAVAAALPGGDPLAAALAAGETPSPEMVASMGRADGLRPAIGLAFVAAVIVALIGIVALSRPTEMLRIVELEKPPAVLVADAREVLERLGYSAPPGDWVSGFTADNEYLGHAEEKDDTATRWDGLATIRPAPIQFWYRQSPRKLVASRATGTASYSNPPMRLPGMARIRLDPQGRLLSLLVVPPHRDESLRSDDPTDWAPLFELAGLDMAEFTPSPAQWNPWMDTDERAAWEGSFPDQPDEPVRIEAGSYRGRPSFFAVLPSWFKPIQAVPEPADTGARIAGGMLIVLFVVILGGGIFFARRNIQLGRGDRRGAFRMALYMFLAALAQWALGSHHVWGVAELAQLFMTGIQGGLLLGVIVWVVYMALEPYVRKLWPHALIAWTRLLAGNFRDPLLGRDILVGAIAGSGVALTGLASTLIPQWIGAAPTRPRIPPMTVFQGTRETLGGVISGQIGALIVPISLFLFILVMRVILRKSALAVGAVFLIMTALSAMQSFDTPWDIALSALVWAIIIGVTIRFGLLASVLTFFFQQLLVQYPLTLDTSLWYAARASLPFLLVPAFVVYGFFISLAGRPLFRGDMLGD